MKTLPQWLDYIAGQHWQSIDMGLERMQQMVQRLALHKPAPVVITVAGTNGKGSTCRACEALLLEAGLSVGCTLSPHVSRFNERIRIGGEEVSDTQICDAFAAVEEARDTLPLTYFEFAALASLYLFARAGVQAAVLEIGLGGRLDAYNVIDADIAVITSIGLDHQQFLGTSLEQIGAEKAGILRAGQQVVLGPDMPQSVLARCAQLHLRPTSFGVDFKIEVDMDSACWHLDLHEQGALPLDALPLGAVAPQNLALAYMACRQVVPGLGHEALTRVNRTLQLPGRMQRVSMADRQWLLDVAHNPAGAAFLAAALAQRRLEPALIVCGMLRDKDHAGVIEQLSDAVDAPWLFVDTRGERGMPGSELATRGAVRAHRVVEWEALIDVAISETRPGDVILLFGSFDVIEQFSLLHAA